MSLNTVVEKYNANISRSGIYARFHVPISGTITAADVLAATVSGYNWIFNVAINGTGQFAGASRFNVGVGTESVHKTGLSIAVTKGDIITFVCEAAGTGGGLFAPTEFAITIDDGLSASDVLGPASATDNAIALFDGTTGKLIKDSTKTISTDGTLAGNSDALIPTQKAVKTYSDQLLAAADAMTFKGVIDCSANPNYPAGNAGDVYRVSVGGKIGGGSGINVEVADQLLCLTDSTASGDQATVGANWSIAQANIDGAVVGPTSATADAIALFNSTTGKIIKDSAVVISTDGTFASNSDAKIPTEKAVKTYVTAAVAGGGGGGAAVLTDQAGTPSDTPSTAGGWPIRFDDATSRIWVYNGSTWLWYNPAGSTGFDVTWPTWARYEADHESQTAGAAATGWADLSGNGRNLTNGSTVPVKRIDSGIHSFDMSAGAWFVGTDASALTEAEVFVIWRNDSTGVSRLHDFGSSTDQYFPYTDGKMYDGFGSTTRHDAISFSGATRTNFWAYNAVSKSGEWTLRANGTQLYTTATNTFSYRSSARWGSVSAGTCSGRIAAIYLFSPVLTTTQRTNFKTYILAKYGITIV